MPVALALVLSSAVVSVVEGQAGRALPDSGALVRLHTPDGIARGRLLVPFRRDATSIRFCNYPGPPCDANTPADRLLEMRTDAIRSMERSVGSHWREGAVIGGLIGAGIGVFGVALAEGWSEGGQSYKAGRYIRVGTLTGVFFAGIGAMFTGSSQKWEVVF
jgi:hypothetical protein